MADDMLRIAGRSPSGLAKAVKTDDEGNITTKLAGKKVEWINHFTNQTITANNNSDPTYAAFRDISDFDEVEIYVLCNKPYNIKIEASGDNDTFRYIYLDWKQNEPATTGKNAKIYSLRNLSGDILRFDRINPIILNPSPTESLIVTIKIRGYRKVAR